MINGNNYFMAIVSSVGGFLGIKIWQHDGDIKVLKSQMVELSKLHDTTKETNELLKCIAKKMKIRNEEEK